MMSAPRFKEVVDALTRLGKVTDSVKHNKDVCEIVRRRAASLLPVLVGLHRAQKSSSGAATLSTATESALAEIRRILTAETCVRGWGGAPGVALVRGKGCVLRGVRIGGGSKVQAEESCVVLCSLPVGLVSICSRTLYWRHTVSKVVCEMCCVCRVCVRGSELTSQYQKDTFIVSAANSAHFQGSIEELEVQLSHNLQVFCPLRTEPFGCFWRGGVVCACVYVRAWSLLNVCVLVCACFGCVCWCVWLCVVLCVVICAVLCMVFCAAVCVCACVCLVWVWLCVCVWCGCGYVCVMPESGTDAGSWRRPSGTVEHPVGTRVGDSFELGVQVRGNHAGAFCDH